MANGIHAKCKGIVKDVLVVFDELFDKLDFLAVEEATVDALTGLTDLKELQTILDLGEKFVDFVIGGQAVRFRLRPETDEHSKDVKLNENEDVITDSSTSPESLTNYIEDHKVSSLEEKEYLVVTFI